MIEDEAWLSKERKILLEGHKELMMMGRAMLAVGAERLARTYQMLSRQAETQAAVEYANDNIPPPYAP